MNNTLTVEIEAKPAFGDVDPMGVVWHGHYFRFFEQAREALFDSIGFGYDQMRLSGYFWPIVETRVKYIAPVTLGQMIHVSAALTEFENRFCIEYVITDAVTGQRLTKASTIQVAVESDSREICFASPQAFLDKINARLQR